MQQISKNMFVLSKLFVFSLKLQGKRAIIGVKFKTVLGER